MYLPVGPVSGSESPVDTTKEIYDEGSVSQSVSQ